MNYANQRKHIKGEIRIHRISILVLILLASSVVFLMVWTWNMGGRWFMVFWCGFILVFLAPIPQILKDIRSKKKVLKRIEKCEKWKR